jgi:hypothetical protein
VPLLKRFARTIEVEVGPEYFVYRYGQKENRVLTRGYIRKSAAGETSWAFSDRPEMGKCKAISLFSAFPPELREDFVDILAAFLSYGVRPLSNFIRPVIIITGMERFAAGSGFEYATFAAAAKLVALAGTEVYFK